MHPRPARVVVGLALLTAWCLGLLLLVHTTTSTLVALVAARKRSAPAS